MSLIFDASRAVQADTSLAHSYASRSGSTASYTVNDKNYQCSSVASHIMSAIKSLLDTFFSWLHPSSSSHNSLISPSTSPVDGYNVRQVFPDDEQSLSLELSTPTDSATIGDFHEASREFVEQSTENKAKQIKKKTKTFRFNEDVKIKPTVTEAMFERAPKIDVEGMHRSNETSKKMYSTALKAKEDGWKEPPKLTDGLIEVKPGTFYPQEQIEALKLQWNEFTLDDAEYFIEQSAQLAKAEQSTAKLMEKLYKMGFTADYDKSKRVYTNVHRLGFKTIENYEGNGIAMTRIELQRNTNTYTPPPKPELPELKEGAEALPTAKISKSKESTALPTAVSSKSKVGKHLPGAAACKRTNTLPHESSLNHINQAPEVDIRTAKYNRDEKDRIIKSWGEHQEIDAKEMISTLTAGWDQPDIFPDGAIKREMVIKPTKDPHKPESVQKKHSDAVCTALKDIGFYGSYDEDNKLFTVQTLKFIPAGKVDGKKVWSVQRSGKEFYVKAG